MKEKKVFITGGEQNNTIVHYAKSVDFDGVWEDAIVMKRERQKHCSIYFENCIYVVGGHNNRERTLPQCELQDLNTRRWKSLPDLRIRREGCRLVTYSQQLMAIGGWNGKHNIPEIETLNLDSDTDESWKIIHVSMDFPWE